VPKSANRRATPDPLAIVAVHFRWPNACESDACERSDRRSIRLPQQPPSTSPPPKVSLVVSLAWGKGPDRELAWFLREPGGGLDGVWPKREDPPNSIGDSGCRIGLIGLGASK
jgi:hypothetical protein